MRQLKLKFADVSDTEEAVEWLNSTPNNLFDADILTYPTFKLLCSYPSHKGLGEAPIAYLPMQNVLALESLGVNPRAEMKDRVQAFRDLVKGSELVASSQGIKEIHFLCADADIIDMAENHGFEKVPYTLLRMKL